jgi:hypothetical protein
LGARQESKTQDLTPILSSFPFSVVRWASFVSPTYGLTIPELLQSLDAHVIGERLLAKVRGSVRGK